MVEQSRRAVASLSTTSMPGDGDSLAARETPMSTRMAYLEHRSVSVVAAAASRPVRVLSWCLESMTGREIENESLALVRAVGMVVASERVDVLAIQGLREWGGAADGTRTKFGSLLCRTLAELCGSHWLCDDTLLPHFLQSPVRSSKSFLASTHA